eukprot:gene17103-23400_t
MGSPPKLVHSPPCPESESTAQCTASCSAVKGHQEEADAAQATASYSMGQCPVPVSGLVGGQASMPCPVPLPEFPGPVSTVGVKLEGATQVEASQLVELISTPYNGKDLLYHPVTDAMSKASYDKADACIDVRKRKGSITSFFKPSSKKAKPDA